MIRKDIKRTIQEHYFQNPSARMRVREMERTLHLPLPSVIRYCKELEKEHMLKTIRTGTVVFYAADRGEEFLREKQLYNIRQLHESGLIAEIKERLHGPAIVLFGSYARGEDTEESDIDLYLETPSKSVPDLKKYEEKLDRKIQLFTYKNIRAIPNPHLANNIINGIVLSGQIEVFG